MNHHRHQQKQEQRKRPLPPDRVADNNDRISCLHDSVLHHILSFLCAKDVVRTCLVSKRWQDLWKSHPCVDFSRLDFTDSDNSMEFIYYFMHRRDNNSTVIRFSLAHCPDNIWDASYIWTNPLLNAGVQELRLEIPRYRRLPSCIYTVNSLVTLKLEAVSPFVQFPDVFCFPKLKNMHLHGMIFGKSFISQLLLKSPNLENLSFRLCFADKSFSFSSSCIDHDLYLRSFCNLGEADLHMSFDNYAGAVSTFIRMLSNVRILYLYNSCIKLLRYERNLLLNLPSFCNLKHLDVWLSAKEGDIGVMGCLVNCSPLLQYLRITFTDDNIDYWRGHWKPVKLLIRVAEDYLIESLTLPRSLKWVRMKEFGGQEKQVELLKHLLRNDQFLQKIIVEVINTQLQSLSQLLRPSTATCVLDVRPRTWFDSFAGLRCL